MTSNGAELRLATAVASVERMKVRWQRSASLAHTLLCVRAMQASCNAVVAALALFTFSCAVEEEADGRDDVFPTGKGDGVFEEGSWQALSALRVANTATLDELTRSISDDGVGLTRSAARGIVAFRAGPDGVVMTADDRTFTSLRQLDDIPYVGPVSLRRLVDYAVTNGLAVSNAFRCETSQADAPSYEGLWKSATAEWPLEMHETHELWSNVLDCAPSWSQATPGVIRYGCYFEPEWSFYVPSFAVKFPADARTRTSAFTVEIVSVTSDRRYADGYRERAGTAVMYSCTPTSSQ
jgi:hypothetical protein